MNNRIKNTVNYRIISILKFQQKKTLIFFDIKIIIIILSSYSKKNNQINYKLIFSPYITINTK
jgi:hypothetical protein